MVLATISAVGSKLVLKLAPQQLLKVTGSLALFSSVEVSRTLELLL